MYCRKCGKNIPDDSEYCPYCGIPTIPGDAKTNILRLMLIAALPLIAVILICVLMVIYLPSRNDTTKDTTPHESSASTLPPKTTAEEAKPAEPAGEPQQTGDSDPWRHVDTMEQAEEILGFGLEAPEIVKDFEAPWINVAAESSSLWVLYHKYTQEHDPMYYDKIITVDRSVYIVKYPCPDGVVFVSPDAKQKLIKVDDNDVILILNNTEVVEANWAADGYAYTVSFENMGLTARSVAPILSQIH